MTKRQEPAITLATLRDDMIDQASDYKILERARRTYAEKMGELNPETYAPEFLERRTLEIQAELSAKIGPALARIAERKDRAQAARAMWQPDRRRLEASLADPVMAAALSSRIALVPATDLPRLARDAAERQDWLLADAVLIRVGQLELDQEALAVGEQVTTAMQGIDAENTARAVEAMVSIGEDFVRAQIVRAEIDGKPLSPVAKLALAHEHPGALSPVGT